MLLLALLVPPHVPSPRQQASRAFSSPPYWSLDLGGIVEVHIQVRVTTAGLDLPSIPSHDAPQHTPNNPFPSIHLMPFSSTHFLYRSLSSSLPKHHEDRCCFHCPPGFCLRFYAHGSPHEPRPHRPHGKFTFVPLSDPGLPPYACSVLGPPSFPLTIERPSNTTSLLLSYRL